MNDSAIGVFDSGIGGLALVNELNKWIAPENVIFHYDPLILNDTKDEKEQVREYTQKNISYLINKNVKMIISCSSEANTVYGLKSPESEVKYSGIFLPAAQAACGATKNNKIAVLGSPQVVKKGGYVRTIKNIKPTAAVIGCVCPLLSQMLETGLDESSQAVKKELTQALNTVTEDHADTVIVAQGQFFAAQKLIREILGPDVSIISPYEETAKQAYNYLLSSDLLSERDQTGINEINLEDNKKEITDMVSLFIDSSNTVYK